MHQIVEAHGRTIRDPFAKPPASTEGARARAFARGRGLLRLTEDAARLRGPESSVPDAGAFLVANEELARFYEELDGFADQVELVADRNDRRRYVLKLEEILREQERRALDVLRPTNTRPYPHVIIAMETSRRIPMHAEPMRPRVESFSERPWMWEGRFWDGARAIEQDGARRRLTALRITGIPVPRPVLVANQTRLEMVRSALLCRAPR